MEGRSDVIHDVADKILQLLLDSKISYSEAESAIRIAKYNLNNVIIRP